MFALPDLSGVSTASDGELLRLLRDVDAIERDCAAAKARIVAEVARRSTPGAGHDGLAARTGARTVEGLVQQVTGASKSRAPVLVQAGEALTGASPWLSPVADAVAGGAVSVDAAAAIRAGLGDPAPGVAADDLLDAARSLVDAAPGEAPERIAVQAQQARARLDAAGTVDRARLLSERRYLALVPRDDGMTRITGLLDPESAALVGGMLDRATSPRRGGPRFVDRAKKSAAADVAADPRTIGQLAHDALIDLLRLGAAVDPAGPPTTGSGVRVHVAAADLDRGTGHGILDDTGAPVSPATVERIGCTDGITPIRFGADGAVLDLGRSRRLFSRAQRIALTARALSDGTGGCAAPGCPRPPGWCEIHHIRPWQHGGRTDLHNAVLLCRHHHLVAHDRRWRISRRADGRVLVEIPERDRDPA